MTYGVARLLSKDLSKLDHLGRVELFRKIHHCVRVVLLVTRAGTSEQGAKGRDRYLIAFRATVRSILKEH